MRKLKKQKHKRGQFQINITKGYKAFFENTGVLTCRNNTKYTLNSVATVSGFVYAGVWGIHFCPQIWDITTFYNLGARNVVVANVSGTNVHRSEALPGVCATNHLNIGNLLNGPYKAGTRVLHFKNGHYISPGKKFPINRFGLLVLLVVVFVLFFWKMTS